MASPRLSICITTHNRLALLPRLLAHLDGLGDEIVVLDSLSDDGSAELLAAHPRVRLIQRGFDGHYGRHKNEVLDAARGDWILLLDSDELLGAGLKAVIPRAIASFWYSHYKLPRCWLAPRGAGAGAVAAALADPHYVDAPGLYPDWQLRLFRNRPPFRYPPDAAVHEHFPRTGRGRCKKLAGQHLLHLDFLLNDRAAREAKVARYAALGPGDDAARTSRVYLWEDLPHRVVRCGEGPAWGDGRSPPGDRPGVRPGT